MLGSNRAVPKNASERSCARKPSGEAVAASQRKSIAGTCVGRGIKIRQAHAVSMGTFIVTGRNFMARTKRCRICYRGSCRFIRAEAFLPGGEGLRLE